MEKFKKILLVGQLLLFAGLLLILIGAIAGGARPSKTPKYEVVMSAQQKYQNCIDSANKMPEGLQDNALENCNQVQWADEIREVK